MMKNLHLFRNGRRLFSEFEKGEWYRRAAETLTDPRRVNNLLRLTLQLFRTGALVALLEDGILAVQYVRDVTKGRYRAYNGKVLLLIVAMLLYVVSPIDLVPDWIPGAGLLDDAALVTYILRLADAELQRYRAYAEGAASAPQ